MTDFPESAKGLICQSKKTHGLPKIHYWKRLLKEIKNQNNDQYWRCFSFHAELENKNFIKVHEKTPNKEVAGQRVYLESLGSEIYLTPREVTVSVLLCQGLKCKQIAKQLNISDRTVEFYIRNLKLKFNCRFKIELINIFNQLKYLKK